VQQYHDDGHPGPRPPIPCVRHVCRLRTRSHLPDDRASEPPPGPDGSGPATEFSPGSVRMWPVPAGSEHRRMDSLVEVAAARAVGITKRYGSGPAAVTALDNVTVAVPEARFTAIMGRSGSGKSTLLHCLAGLDSVDAGAVYLGDTDLTGLSERELT